MLSYIVIASKTGRKLPPALLSPLRQPDVPELFFVPEEHTEWTNAAGTIAFFGWQAATTVAQVRSHWHISPDRLTAFSGHLWPRGSGWSSDRPWAEMLSEYLARRRPGDAFEDFFGCYTLADLREEGGSVMSDPFGSCLVYRAENADAVALSNRATLAARAVSGNGLAAPRSVDGAGWLPYFAHVVGTDTTIEGVRTLLPGEIVLFGSDGAERRVLASSPVWRSPSAESDIATAEVLEDLVGNVRSASSVTAQKRILRLSGGKDSRLVLALIVAAGVQDRFTCVTVGPSHSADVVVAKAIAHVAGVELEHHLPTPSTMRPEQFERQLRIHTFQTSGMLGAFTLKGSLSTSSNLSLSGLFGELFRSHYAKSHRLDTTDALRRFFAETLRFDPGGLFRSEARQRYRAGVNTWLEEMLVDGEPPEDVADIFYLQHRLRRWVGTAQEVNGMSVQAAPLQSLVGTRAAFRAGARSRRIDSMHFDLVRLACEPLAKMPLANQTWHPETYRHLPDADDYASLEPFKAESGTAPERWQIAKWEDNMPVARAYLGSKTNPVFDVLDFGKVQEMLDGGGDRSLHGREQLYGALAAAVWLGRHELPERIPSVSGGSLVKG